MAIFLKLLLFIFLSLVNGQGILGCMDSYAENYNIDATTDDGSCAGYPDNGDHSLSFDGIDDYGYLSWNNQLSTYTVSMWVRAHDLNQISYQAFFNNSSNSNQGFQLDCNNNEQYRFLSSNGSILLAPLDLEWAHVSITSNGTTTAAYFNGELIETVNWVVTGWDQIVLGRNRSTNEPGNYNLDEISIWNTSKSITEIQELMNNDFDVNEEGLLVYWKANAGESNIVFDHTGNTNHMTLYGATWIDGNPGYPQIEVLPDAISHLAYTGEFSNQSFTIYNNGNDDLEWILSFNNQERIHVPFALPEGFTTQNNVSGNISTGPVLVGQSNINNNNINRDQYDIWIYNNSGVASEINGHESLNAVTGSALEINNFDVFFNIRSSNYNPEETLEWVYNGGTWVGEWSSNDYPINNWNVIEGSVYTGNAGAYGTPIIQDPNHWLAQNIDWGSVPVGTEAVEFMRNIIIDDPDANVIVSLNHASYGEVPLLVEKNYGEGTIILFNCDYQDAPHTVSDLIQKVAYYAAAIAGKVEWLSVSDTLGTVLPGNSTEIELTFDATSLGTGDYESEFFILSNDPDQPNISIPVDLEVDMYFPNISLSLDSFHVDLFVGDTVVQTLTIQNNGEADLNWTGITPFSWVMLNPESGVIHIENEQVIELMFHTNQWAVGSYASSLHVASNDEDEPDLYIPLSLTIFDNIEAPEFGDTSIYEDSTLALLLPDLYSQYTTEYVISSDTSDVNVNIISDSLILSPVENWTGSAVIEVILIAEDTLTDTSFFMLNVMPVNDSPILSAIEDTVMTEDSSLSIPLIFSDVDNEELSLFVTNSHDDYIYMEIIDATLYIEPNPDWNGDSIFVEVFVNDNMDRSIAEENFFLTVYPVNDLPEFEHNLNITVGVGIDFEFNLSAYDVDMDSTFFILDNTFDYPDWFTIETNPDRLLGIVPVDGTFDFPIILSDGDSSIIDTFNITAHYYEPRINFISDVPEDQGGKVYLNFQKSFLDILDNPNQFYTILRNDTVGDTASWVGIGSLTASGSELYTTEVHTLRDSSSINNGLTEFKVISFMNTGTFESEIMIGYSLDNIAPEVPQDLSVTVVDNGIEIFWSNSTDDNFNFFNLDKSNEESFLNYQTFIIDDTFYRDEEYEPSQAYFYRLSAVDLSGNISDYSATMGVTTLKLKDDLIPREFALHPNYPNPFNPVTTLRYDLPVSSDILIRIYDINGRVVKTIFSGYKKAGHNTAVWDAKNDIGEPVSAGMYLYLIQTSEFRKTKKMLLLK